MGQMTVPGKVVADTIELRFAFSGKLARVEKRLGDVVKKKEVVAALEATSFQAELDRELADFEETRAEWEIFNLKHKEIVDDVTRYVKVAQQARLNSAVKDVELAKARMDQVILNSPVNGIVVDDGGNRVGINVTPSANAFLVLDYDSIRFRLELTYDKMNFFNAPKDAVVRIPGVDREFTGRTSLPLAQIKDMFVVDIALEGSGGIFRGQPGEAIVTF